LVVTAVVIDDLEDDGAYHVCFLLADLFVLVGALTDFETDEAEGFQAN